MVCSGAWPDNKHLAEVPPFPAHVAANAPVAQWVQLTHWNGDWAVNTYVLWWRWQGG